jgi:hypothetical protein
MAFREGVDLWEIVEPYIIAGRDWETLRASYPDVDEA